MAQPWPSNPLQPMPAGVPQGMPVGGHGPNYPGGIDPALYQKLLRSLQNPDAGDAAAFANAQAVQGAMPESLNFFPKPLEMLYGALIGVGFFNGIEWLFRPGKGGGERIARVVRSIDNVPGIRHVSRFLDEHVIGKLTDYANRKNKGYLQQMLNRMAPDAAEKLVVQDTVNTLKGEIAEELLEKLAKEETADGVLKAIGGIRQTSEAVLIENHAATLRRYLGNLPGNTKIPPDLVNQLLQEANSVGHLDKIVHNKGIFRRFFNWIRGRKPPAIAPEALAELTTLIEQAKLDRNLARRLLGLEKRVGGLKNLFFSHYRAQHHLTEAMIEKGVGPIGRAIASVMDTIRRIFGGSTVGLARAGAAGAEQSWMGKLMESKFAKLGLLPAFMGAITIGQSFSEASRAEKGDKVATFFHNFLGLGLGNFIGWEISRTFLNKGNIALNFLEKIGLKKLTTRIVLRIPIAGWAFTAAGFITELIAMFGVGYAFQKVGEGISNLIFGKPKSVHKQELEDRGITLAMAPDRPLRRIGRYNGFEQELHRQPAAAMLEDRTGSPSVRRRPAAATQATAGLRRPEEIMESPAQRQSQAFEESLLGDVGDPDE